MGFGPQLVDFDADGDRDIISGSWPGELYLFRRGEGGFAAAENLADRDGNQIKVGSASAVYAHDWDGDGDLDLVIGEISGDVYLAANEGTAKEPQFATPTKLQADGKDVHVAGDAGPTVADWDGDGRADLLVGAGDGSVTWFRNTSAAGAAKLAAGSQLVAAAKNHGQVKPGEGCQCGSRSKICATDFNGDGRLDLLLGDFALEQIQRGELSEEEQAAKAEVEERYQKVIKQYQEVVQQVLKDSADVPAEQRTKLIQEKTKDLMEELQAASLERSKYQPSRYEYHGWVWVLLREAPAEAAGP